MSTRLTQQRRFTIHVPQLVGRISYPQAVEATPEGVQKAMRRLVSEYDTAMAELQNFLKYLQSMSDEVVSSGAYYPGTPELVDADAGDPGTPGVGWSPGDHKHQADTAAPVGLANANTFGSELTLPRSDHQHKRDVRVKWEGADVATRNALDFRGTASVFWTPIDDPGNDEVDIFAFATPYAEIVIVSTTPYVLGEDEFILLVDATAGDITIQLHPAADIPGRTLEVKKIDASANKVIIDADGADLIEGDATLELLFEGESVPLVSDGVANWWVR
jgi:hypothetical protein